MFVNLSNDQRKLWAKWSPKSPQLWHPVACHLIDVANVATALWSDSLGNGLREWLARELEFSVDSAGRWIAFWIGLHDLGKISPAFQRQVHESIPSLRDCGFEFPGDDKQRVPHGSITDWTLPELLNRRFGMSEKCGQAIGESVGGHHGLFTPPQTISKDALQIGRGRWGSARAEVVDWLSDVLKLPPIEHWPTERPSTAWLLTLAGLTSVADWLGSMAEVFPPAGPDVDFAAYVIESQQKAKQLVRDVGWSGWQPPPQGRSLVELFPRLKEAGPRPLQRAAEELTDELLGPSLVLIEAPMGEGKTEAAMLLADHWAARCGQRGCYFALPTMATSNQMFGRVREFLEQTVEDGQRANLLLLHGRASLSDALRELLADAERWDTASIELDREDRAALPHVIASEWFTYRKRGLLAPFGVGTVDQVLLAALQTKHVFVRLFGLAHKTVIIDEVHAYDTYMQQLLERLLEWLHAIGASVVLLSATLPQDRRTALLKAYAGKSATMEQPAKYPRLSWVETGATPAIRSRHFDATMTRTIRLREFSADVSAWGLSLAESLQQGGCAAVICNTVRRAQEVYVALQEFFVKAELDLFHARYPFGEREAREQRTLTTFGKPSEDRASIAGRPRRVLVATQVIEQSLDIDFDLMITELAPVDLVLQRAGRLHRHNRVRPAGLTEPTLCLLVPSEEESTRRPDWGGSGYVYAPHILLRSWLALRQRTAITLPSDIEPLIEQIYDSRECPDDLPTELRDEWQSSLKKLKDERAKSGREADQRQIKMPRLKGSLSKIVGTDSLDEDAPQLHPKLQALTRLGPPTVSIVCLAGTKNEPRWIERLAKGSGVRKFGIGGNQALTSEHAPLPPIPNFRTPDPGTQRPSRDELELFIRSSVSVSHPGVVKAVLADGFQPPAWHKSALLRQQYAVFFDDDGRAPVGDYILELHPDLGLMFHRCDDLEDL